MMNGALRVVRRNKPLSSIGLRRVFIRALETYLRHSLYLGAVQNRKTSILRTVTKDAKGWREALHRGELCPYREVMTWGERLMGNARWG